MTINTNQEPTTQRIKNPTQTPCKPLVIHNMKLISSSLFLFNKRKETWLWPSCKNPKTLSFRAASGDIIFKTVNSVFFDPKYSQPEEAEVLTTPDSYFTNSSESASISTESEEFLNTNEYYGSSLETIVRGARSERLFFEPGPTTSSILEGNKQCGHAETGGDGGGGGSGDNSGGGVPYKESVAMAIESDDPRGDFKKSMEEMVASHGLKDNWECLEELLGWYLRMNGKNHHEIIVGAFVDLLAGISGGGGDGNDGGTGGGDGGGGSSDHSTVSFTSVASTFTSPIASPLSKGGGEKKKMIINQ